MDDLISRQAAIERFDYIRPRDPMTSDYTHGIDVGIALCKVAIREQPPAQLSTNLASLGTDCSEFPNNSDAISRQAAIDALHTFFRDGFDEDKWWNSTHVLAAIEGLPPAEPKRGKWIVDRYGIVICSECRKPRRDNRIDHIGWCNGCGAKMEVTT